MSVGDSGDDVDVLFHDSHDNFVFLHFSWECQCVGYSEQHRVKMDWVRGLGKGRVPWVALETCPKG